MFRPSLHRVQRVIPPTRRPSADKNKLFLEQNASRVVNGEEFYLEVSTREPFEVLGSSSSTDAWRFEVCSKYTDVEPQLVEHFRSAEPDVATVLESRIREDRLKSETIGITCPTRRQLSLQVIIRNLIIFSFLIKRTDLSMFINML